MSTITAQVTTTVSAIPLLRHRDTVVNFPADQDDFVAKYEATNDHLSGTTVPQINAVGDQIDVITGQINTVAGEVNINAGTATTKATLATDYAEKMALEVETGTYSSKEHAIGDLTITGGSAKAWATDTASPDGTTAKSAKTLAAEAAVSATNAYNSELAAGAILDGFDDRYLGAKTADPTLDNDGNPLTAGAMYYNTALDTMKVYDLQLIAWVSISFIPTAHSGLTGLANDDHPQYHNDTRGDARYLKLVGGNLTGAINTARATVASAATTADIWGALGNQIDFTGTATVTAFPNAPQAGATRELICAGACSFTAGTNMLIDGVPSGTVTCAANDKIIVRATSTTTFNLTRLKADGTSQVSPLGMISDYQEFTISGTWTKPIGATYVYVELLGGGGGGGNETTATGSGYGGSGGGFVSKIMSASSLSTTESVVIGAGGAGTPNSSETNASNGGNSSFGTLISRGGYGGGNGTGIVTCMAGATTERIGSSTLDYSAFSFVHASPCGLYGVNNHCLYGGGAGGATLNNDSYAASTSTYAGNGGAGIATASIKGGNGVYPAGGGGGSSNNGGGGDGASGRARVWTW